MIRHTVDIGLVLDSETPLEILRLKGGDMMARLMSANRARPPRPRVRTLARQAIGLAIVFSGYVVIVIYLLRCLSDR
jgi:hypothetical protein